MHNRLLFNLLDNNNSNYISIKKKSTARSYRACGLFFREKGLDTEGGVPNRLRYGVLNLRA